MRKHYCTQNHGDCSSCSLVNYNRDCNNVPLDRLTPTEQKIYTLVIQGKKNKFIAEQLDIKERTVETHMRSILIKTKCKNRVELIVKELKICSTQCEHNSKSRG